MGLWSHERWDVNVLKQSILCTILIAAFGTFLGKGQPKLVKQLEHLSYEVFCGVEFSFEEKIVKGVGEGTIHLYS